MQSFWGILLTILSLITWFGQALTAFAPKWSARIGFSEPQTDVNSTIYTDMRGEAIWDTMIIWPLSVAGILLMLSNPAWVYFGLVGSGMYLYFAGRFITTRLVMQRQGIPIGKPETIKLYFGIATVWVLMAISTIIIAVTTNP